MFPHNLDSVEEDISKKRFEETQTELIEKPKNRFVGQLTNTLIAGIIAVGVLFLFLWIIDEIRY